MLLILLIMLVLLFCLLCVDTRQCFRFRFVFVSLSSCCSLFSSLLCISSSPCSSLASFRYLVVSLFFCFCFLPFRCLLRYLRFFLRFLSVFFFVLRLSSFVRSFLLFIVVGSCAAVFSRGWRSSLQHRLLSSSCRFPASGFLPSSSSSTSLLAISVVLDIGDLSIVVQVARPGPLPQIASRCHGKQRAGQVPNPI